MAKTRTLAETYNIAATSDRLADLLDDVQPDFVDVCTAVETHLALTRVAADRGIGVLCQKPVAPTMAETDELIDYCASRGVRLMINDNWRWQAWYREIKTILDAGRLGQVFSVYLAMRPGDGWGLEPYAVQPYFREMPRFLLFETGLHYADTLRFLFGEVVSVYCRIRRVNPAITGEDVAVVCLNFVDGLSAIFDGNRVAHTSSVRPPMNGFLRIEGTEGNLRADEAGRLFLMPRGESERPHEYAIPGGYRGGSVVAAQQHFVDCLAEGTEFETNGRDYRKSAEIVFACYQSAAEDRVVRM